MKIRTDFDHVIVEQAEFESPSMFNKELHSKYLNIAHIPEKESFTFPNVDSCLAIIIKLSDKSHVVAHVGLFDPRSYDDLDFDGEHGIVPTQMILDVLPKDVIPINLVLIGAADRWSSVNNLKEALKLRYSEIDVDDAKFQYEDHRALDIQVDRTGKIETFDTNKVTQLMIKSKMDKNPNPTENRVHQPQEIKVR